MSSFVEEAGRCTYLLLSYLDGLQKDAEKELQTSGSTKHIRYLQSVSMQRNIIACGLFSLFESSLQNKIGGNYVFKNLKKALENKNQANILDRLILFKTINNSLKHGDGPSYKNFMGRTDPDATDYKNKYFDKKEGDLSYAGARINATNKYILDLMDLIIEIELFVNSNLCIP